MLQLRIPARRPPAAPLASPCSPWRRSLPSLRRPRPATAGPPRAALPRARATGWWPPTVASSPTAGPASSARPGHPAQPADRGHGADAVRRGLLAGGLGRRDLLLRRRPFFGSTGAIRLNKPIVGMASTPSGGATGWWRRTAASSRSATPGSSGRRGPEAEQADRGDGGDAVGRGYWLVASDGGIFSFGDARFFGSTGALTLAQPIVGMAATPPARATGWWRPTAACSPSATPPSTGPAPERPDPGRGPAVGRPWCPARRAGATGRPAPPVSCWPSATPSASATPPRSTVPWSAWRPSRTAGTPGATDGSAVSTHDPDHDAAGPAVVPPPVLRQRGQPHVGHQRLHHRTGKAGRVLALAEAGDKVFVAGEFAGAALPRSAATATRCASRASPRCRRRPLRPPPLPVRPRRARRASSSTGTPNPTAPSCRSMASPDGKRLYVGGRFTSIGGAPAGRLALLDVATATQVPTFKPPKPDSSVRAMALAGDTLYIGGSFRQLTVGRRPAAPPAAGPGGRPRRRHRCGAGRVPAGRNTGGRFFGHTGTPTEDGVPGVVYDMAVSGDGRTLYVAGDFLHFGGQGGVVGPRRRHRGADRLAAGPRPPRPVFGVAIWPGDGASLVAATGGTGRSAQFFTPSRGTRRRCGWARSTATPSTSSPPPSGSTWSATTTTACPTRTIPARAVPVSCPNGTPHRKLIAFEARTGDTDAGFTAQANTARGPTWRSSAPTTSTSAATSPRSAPRPAPSPGRVRRLRGRSEQVSAPAGSPPGAVIRTEGAWPILPLRGPGPRRRERGSAERPGSAKLCSAGAWSPPSSCRPSTSPSRSSRCGGRAGTTAPARRRR